MVDAGIGTINIRVLICEPDVYALQKINSYLAWDRRTRVTAMYDSVEKMWQYLEQTPQAERPDMVVIAADHVGGHLELQGLLHHLREAIPSGKIICLSQSPDIDLIHVAVEGGAHAFMLKQEVGLRIAGALVYAENHDFLITPGIRQAASHMIPHHRLHHAVLLPEQRKYAEMTDRIEQAIRLVVIEGMPALLAAHEMSISLHTIRGYIKEGYRILESFDDTEYPIDMTPQERAFMRFTAFDENNLPEA
jgi:DNA-binding NarL/FixJ family response regulator